MKKALLFKVLAMALNGEEVAGNPDVNGDSVVCGADVTALYTTLLEQ